MQNTLQNKVTLAVLGTIGGVTCLVASGNKSLHERYLLHEDNISKIALSLGAIMLSGGTWLYCHQLEENLKVSQFKSSNRQDLQKHFETLKVENATHKMNLDAQISRAKADFLARQEIAALKQEMGFDLSEQAAYHLEEMQYESTENHVADSTSKSGNQEASDEVSGDFQDTEPGNIRNADSTRLEALKTLFLEKLQNPNNPPLFENLERSEKLEILRLVLRENLGIESTILLCWGIKPGGRNHNEYKDARAMLDSMIEELKEQGFTEKK